MFTARYYWRRYGLTSKQYGSAREATSGELLATLACQVDRQMVLNFGGEFLEGSGFEHEIPETGFKRQGVSND